MTESQVDVANSVGMDQQGALEAGSPTGGEGRPIELLYNVDMGVTVELGRTRMTMRELLALRPGKVIELDRLARSPVDVLVNNTLLARGEVVVLDDELGVRITEITANAAMASRTSG
jgi:flagellar motor switch protein FliN/FliY